MKKTRIFYAVQVSNFTNTDIGPMWLLRNDACTNIAVGIITRAAPQLNMFSFAFPVTMILAFFIMYISSQSIGNAFAELTKSSLESIESVLVN